MPSTVPVEGVVNCGGPANGKTNPVGVTMRTALFPNSLKKIKPLALTATPVGV
jgi:hypothetical protein